jgi:hypothetical protein
MVEESVVFIVGHEEGGFTPDLRVIRQRIEYLRDIPCTVIRGPIRVLRVSFRCDHPRDLWQIAAGYILSEDIEERSAGGDVSSSLRAICKRRAGWCVLVLVEVEKRIVAVIADIGVVGEAPGLFGS